MSHQRVSRIAEKGLTSRDIRLPLWKSSELLGNSWIALKICSQTSSQEVVGDLLGSVVKCCEKSRGIPRMSVSVCSHFCSFVRCECLCICDAWPCLCSGVVNIALCLSLGRAILAPCSLDCALQETQKACEADEMEAGEAAAVANGIKTECQKDRCLHRGCFTSTLSCGENEHDLQVGDYKWTSLT